MKCKRCGRILTNKKAIEIGYGNHCFKKMQEEMKNQISIFNFLNE